MPKQAFHRNQFTFYASYFEAVDRLPKARQLEAYRLITDYSLHGVLPEKISPQVGAVFAALRPNIDSSRTKAKARLKELSEDQSSVDVLSPAGRKIADSVSPSGKNKREKENKKENKYKNESEKEREDEYEDEGRDESAQEREDQGTLPRAEPAAAAASVLPSEKETEFSRLCAENPALREPLEELLLHWEKLGRPLTELERRLNAMALSVQEEDVQLESVRRMLRTGARLVQIATSDK